MQTELNHTVKALFGKERLDDISRDDLLLLTRTYPYSSILHFLYSNKLQLSNDHRYPASVSKTALYFSNPHWLHHQLRTRTSVEAVAEMEMAYTSSQEQVTESIQNNLPFIPDEESFVLHASTVESVEDSLKPEEILDPVIEEMPADNSADTFNANISIENKDDEISLTENGKIHLKERSSISADFINDETSQSSITSDKAEPEIRLDSSEESQEEIIHEPSFKNVEEVVSDILIESSDVVFMPDKAEHDIRLDTSEEIQEEIIHEPSFKNIEEVVSDILIESSDVVFMPDKAEHDIRLDTSEEIQEEIIHEPSFKNIEEVVSDIHNESSDVVFPPNKAEPDIRLDSSEEIQEEIIDAPSFENVEEIVSAIPNEPSDIAFLPVENQVKDSAETDIEVLSVISIPAEDLTVSNPIHGFMDRSISGSGNDIQPEGPLIPIEPLYAIDYFASQGIRLREEEQQDQLGKKLKSFTEWLKSMKKIHPEKAKSQLDEKTEAAIKTGAEQSNDRAEILTETMAEVLIKQGLTDQAIEVYEKLSLLNPVKSATFAAKISELKALRT